MSTSAPVSEEKKMETCKPFYVNIILRNKEAVVANAVAEKTGGGILGHLAGFAANQLITDEKVVNDLAYQLIDGLRNAIYEMGISASFRKRYQYQSYVVIRVSISEIDRLTLVLASKGEDFAHYFSTLLACAKNLGINETVNAQIDKKIYSTMNDAMKDKISVAIPAKLAEKGILVDCVTCFAEDQAEFFFDTLETLGVMNNDEEDDNDEDEDTQYF